MIIDSHTHVQRVSGFWDSPPERIISLMDEAGIDKAIIMPYSDEQELVEYMRDCVLQYPDRLIAYARLNPAEGKSAQDILIKSVKEWGIKGLKLHPVGNFVHPSSSLSVDLIKVASQLKIPTLFHSGDEELTLPLQIAAAAEILPEAIIIMGHMGGYFHTEDAILAAEKFPNIYLETSAMPYPEVIREAVSRIGANRVLFASDGPGCPPDLELIKIEKANLTSSDKDLILSGNISNLLNL
jgi:predicted TIM-barrel fold metal-dependent hydrolase